MMYYAAAVIRSPKSIVAVQNPFGIKGHVQFEGMPDSFVGTMLVFNDPDDAAEWGDGAYIPIGPRTTDEKGALL